MEIQDLKKQLSNLNFSELPKSNDRVSEDEVIYNQYCNEKGWVWANKIDQKNLELFITAIKNLYKKDNNNIFLRINLNTKFFSFKFFSTIPDPLLDISFAKSSNSRIQNLNNTNFIREGRKLRVRVSPADSTRKIKYGIILKYFITEKILTNYNKKINFYHILKSFFLIKLVVRLCVYLSKPQKIKKIYRHLLLFLWPIITMSPFGSFAKKVRFKRISKSEFLSLKLVDKNPLNQLVRKPHFDKVTSFGRIKTVGELVEFLKSTNGFESLLQDTKEPIILELDDIPMHLNLKFWQNGNRYFINCILAGYRKNVLSYEKAKDYDCLNEPLYSTDYYSKLELMSYNEIESLLTYSPIAIRENAIASGRHKVFAMIGRLVLNDKYVPFWVDRLL